MNIYVCSCLKEVFKTKFHAFYRKKSPPPPNLNNLFKLSSPLLQKDLCSHFAKSWSFQNPDHFKILIISRQHLCVCHCWDAGFVAARQRRRQYSGGAVTLLPAAKEETECLCIEWNISPIVIGRQKLEELTKHVSTIRSHAFTKYRSKQYLNIWKMDC